MEVNSETGGCSVVLELCSENPTVVDVASAMIFSVVVVEGA